MYLYVLLVVLAPVKQDWYQKLLSVVTKNLSYQKSFASVVPQNNQSTPMC